MSWRQGGDPLVHVPHGEVLVERILDFVDLFVQIVDQVEVAFGDDVGQVEGDLSGRNVRVLAGLLQLGGIERLTILRRAPHGERPVAAER